VNKDAVAHTVTSGVPPAADGRFDSGNFGLNATFSHQFNEAGAVPIFCTLHQFMTATITVLP
jgi:plastocyanin